MGDIVTFRGRPAAAETPEDHRDEVTALEAERAELIAAMRPVIARLAVYGINESPVVLAQAQKLAAIIERPARRTLGGAA
jgi:hypothetical protein